MTDQIIYTYKITNLSYALKNTCLTPQSLWCEV